MSIVYNNILVAVDGSEIAEKAFEKAVSIAKENKSKLIITNVIDTRSFSMFGGSYTQIFSEDAENFAKELLTACEKKANEAGLTNIELIVEHGSPKVKIAKDIAVHYNIDLIICGATGRNAVEHFVIGSVAEHIVRYAKCDVLVIRSNE